MTITCMHPLPLSHWPGCSVYFQSNVEDVAVTLRSRFEDTLRRRGVLLTTSAGPSSPSLASKTAQKGSSTVATASHIKEFHATNSSNSNSSSSGSGRNRPSFPHDIFTGADDSNIRPLSRVCSHLLLHTIKYVTYHE